MSRDYCFTAWCHPEFDKEKVKYICWGEEVCPTTGKQHWQGYVSFPKTYALKGAKEIIGSGRETHIERRKGSRDEARNYCAKDGVFFEFGQFEPVTKEDLFKKPIAFLKEEYPEFYCRYHRGLEKLQTVKGPKWRDVNVTVLWGKTGTGKTRKVMEMDDVFKIDPPYTWWDGYQGEEILLIDDYRTNDIPRGQLLNLLDGYRLRLEVKGSHTWALWKYIYITTNWNPETWDEALMRRINVIERMTL